MNENILTEKVLQILNQVAQNLYKKNLIKSQKKIVLTISGGQDSICLLIIFFLLRTQLLISFDLLFCQHFWQRSSFFTMLHVAKCNFCCSTNIMFFLPLNPLISEKAARDWRHKVIQRTTLFYGYDIATQAHTKSDRIETILFNLIRGTGLTGAGALQFQCFQSLFLYNKFYPVHSISQNVSTKTKTLLARDKAKMLSRKNRVFAPKAKLQLICVNNLDVFDTCTYVNYVSSSTPITWLQKSDRVNQGNLNILRKKTSRLDKTQRIEVNGLFLQTLLKLSFQKVNKKYAFWEIKNKNFLLEFLNNSTSSLPKNFYIIKILHQYTHEQSWYNCCTIRFHLGVKVTFANTDQHQQEAFAKTWFLHAKPSFTKNIKTSLQFEFFRIIGNKKVFKIVNRAKDKNNKVCFFRVPFYQEYFIKDITSNRKLFKRTNTSPNVGNRWVEKVKNNPERKMYKNYYNQLKGITEL